MGNIFSSKKNGIKKGVQSNGDIQQQITKFQKNVSNRNAEIASLKSQLQNKTVKINQMEQNKTNYTAKTEKNKQELIDLSQKLQKQLNARNAPLSNQFITIQRLQEQIESQQRAYNKLANKIKYKEKSLEDYILYNVEWYTEYLFPLALAEGQDVNEVLESLCSLLSLLLEDYKKYLQSNTSMIINSVSSIFKFPSDNQIASMITYKNFLEYDKWDGVLKITPNFFIVYFLYLIKKLDYFSRNTVKNILEPFDLIYIFIILHNLIIPIQKKGTASKFIDIIQKKFTNQKVIQTLNNYQYVDVIFIKQFEQYIFYFCKSFAPWHCFLQIIIQKEITYLLGKNYNTELLNQIVNILRNDIQGYGWDKHQEKETAFFNCKGIWKNKDGSIITVPDCFGWGDIQTMQNFLQLWKTKEILWVEKNTNIQPRQNIYNNSIADIETKFNTVFGGLTQQTRDLVTFQRDGDTVVNIVIPYAFLKDVTDSKNFQDVFGISLQISKQILQGSPKNHFIVLNNNGVGIWDWTTTGTFTKGCKLPPITFNRNKQGTTCYYLQWENGNYFISRNNFNLITTVKASLLSNKMIKSIKAV